MTTNLPVNPALDKELVELLKQRNLNAEKIAQVILKMITEKPGGLTAKNRAMVFDYLHKVRHFTMLQLAQYLRLANGSLLVEIFNMPGNPARMASTLHIKFQRKLVFDGVDVVNDPVKPAVKKKLHEFTDDDAARVIDTRLGRIRDAKMQRERVTAVPPPADERLLLVWGAGKNVYVRVKRMMPVADLEFLVKELKKRKVPSMSDPEIREQLEIDLEREFPPPQGVSPA